MLSQQAKSIEYGLWAALRALEERRDLLEKIEQRARKRGDVRTSERMHSQVQEVRRDIDSVTATISEVLIRSASASQAQ